MKPLKEKSDLGLRRLSTLASSRYTEFKPLCMLCLSGLSLTISTSFWDEGALTLFDILMFCS